jgi:hypothetical protein
MPLAALALAALLTPQEPTATLTPDEFRRLHADLVPKAQEPWQTIPWQLELLPAAEQAQREGKRLFLWSMNGHPLGCT